MDLAYGFVRQGDVFTKSLAGRQLTLTSLSSTEAIDPYMDLYQEIWGLTERERIPAHEPAVAARVGGLFLGIELDREKVGLLYVVAAYEKGKGFYHHSKIMGFRAADQNLGLGLEAKRVHALIAAERGVGRVTWTFDPLLARNASLNFRKLGGVVRTYLENAYGNYGGRYDYRLPSDRFLVEWELETGRVRERLAERGPSAEDLWKQWGEASLYDDPAATPVAPAYRVTVPADILAEAQSDPAAAQARQLAWRRLLQRLLGAGYWVEEFLQGPESEGPEAAYYLLRKE